MDRTLRVLPWVVTLALLALAVGSVRWATDQPVASSLPDAKPPAAAAPDATPDAATNGRGVVPEDGATRGRDVVKESEPEGVLPELLAPERSARLLLPIDRPSQLTLTTGFPGEQSAGEAASAAGPELTRPAQRLERLPPASESPVEPLNEMPLAESTVAAAPAETSAAPCGRLPSVPAESPWPTNSPQPIDDPAKWAGPMISPLANAEPDQVRSEQLEQVARQADRQICHGFDLAGRGAYFAARSEFLGALRLVAEGLDTEQESAVHGRALAAALTAMKEAEDFLPGGSRLEADLDLADIIAGHATPVLKDEAEHMTPLTAMKCYFTFAQEQFAAAAGREIAGSMALHAMGKLHAALAQKKGIPIVAPESQAMVFYQAALLVYPKNYMAANDLGVLLAQCGNYTEARAMLEHSLWLCRQSTSWQNLAVVYRQLGQTALAARAGQQATLLRQAELARRKALAAPTSDVVRWVDPQAFAQTSAGALSPPVANPPSAGAARLAAVPSPGLSAGWSAPAMRSSPAGDPSMPTPAARRTAWGPPTY